MGIFTIGFTKHTAESFFEKLKKNKIEILLDIRLNNTSQLSGFAKYPDIKFFSENLANCKYIHDINFAPSEKILNEYKKKLIDWDEYTSQFNCLMSNRDIENYILRNYSKYRSNNMCLLCSEFSPKQCHRSLVAVYFQKIFNVDIINL
jgi:hypothetical protein